VERAVGALTAYAEGRELPTWEKRGPEPGNLMYRVIEELAKAQAAADVLLEESDSPGLNSVWQAAMVRLERAEAEVTALLPHVSPT
jgi:hypothetical protein